MATVVVKKFPPKVDPWLPGVRTSAAEFLARQAPIGIPLPSALATVTTSGDIELC